METVSTAGPWGGTPPPSLCLSTLSLWCSRRNRTALQCCRRAPSSWAAPSSRATSSNFSDLEECSLPSCLFQVALGHSSGTDCGPRVSGPGSELPEELLPVLQGQRERVLRKDLGRAAVGTPWHGLRRHPPWTGPPQVWRAPVVASPAPIFHLSYPKNPEPCQRCVGTKNTTLVSCFPCS